MASRGWGGGYVEGRAQGAGFVRFTGHVAVGGGVVPPGEMYYKAQDPLSGDTLCAYIDEKDREANRVTLVRLCRFNPATQLSTVKLEPAAVGAFGRVPQGEDDAPIDCDTWQCPNGVWQFKTAGKTATLAQVAR